MKLPPPIRLDGLAELDRLASLALARMGVYAIKNTETGEVYVGLAGDVRTRLSQHRSALRTGRHSNRLLLAAWAEYGEAAFEASVLQFALTYRTLQLAEVRWIRRLAHRGVRLYNLDLVGSRPRRRYRRSTS